MFEAGAMNVKKKEKKKRYKLLRKLARDKKAIKLPSFK